MKYSIKENFYEIFRNKPLEEMEIVEFLKKENIYDEDFEELQIEELRKYIKYRKDREEYKINEKVESEVDGVINQTFDRQFVLLKIDENLKMKKKLKESMLINEKAIPELINNIKKNLTNIENYNNINPIDIIIFSDDITFRSSYKRGKYRIFIKDDNEITFSSLYDLIGIIYELSTFKKQVEKLNSLLKWEVFEQELRKNTLEKNKKNRDFLKKISKKYPKIFKDYQKILNQLTLLEDNNFNDLNRTLDGYHYIFCSKEHLSKLTNFKPTKTFEALTLFSFLGLIDKIHYNKLTIDDKVRINKNKTNKIYKDVNLFSINDFKEKESYIIEKIEKMIDNKLKARDLTQKNILNIFGENEYLRIFPNNYSS